MFISQKLSLQPPNLVSYVKCEDDCAPVAAATTATAATENVWRICINNLSLSLCTQRNARRPRRCCPQRGVIIYIIYYVLMRYNMFSGRHTHNSLCAAAPFSSGILINPHAQNTHIIEYPHTNTHSRTQTQDIIHWALASSSNISNKTLALMSHTHANARLFCWRRQQQL